MFTTLHNHIYSTHSIVKVTLVFFVVLMFFGVLPTVATATTYYVSSTGSDSNDGLSPGAPWQTIGKLTTESPFAAGDQILFNGGDTFDSMYIGSGGITSNATADNPLVFGSYGTGKAIFDPASGSTDGILVYNDAAITIQDLIFTGTGSSTNSATGIFFYADTGGGVTYSGVTIDNVEISGFGEAGITIAGGNGLTGFGDITISSSTIYNNALHGISLFGASNYAIGTSTITGNHIYNIAGKASWADPVGNCIVLGQSATSTISYNRCHDGGHMDDTSFGPVGIWAYESNNITIEYNEVYNYKSATTDGGGFDLDGGVTNSVLQYNYSHDNEGAGYLLYQYSGAGAWSNNIVRYNISENDGANDGYGALTIGTASTPLDGLYVYNNTFYNDVATSNLVTIVDSGNATGTIANNIFYSENGAPLIDTYDNTPSTSLSFVNNNYYNTGSFMIDWDSIEYTSFASWQTAADQEKIGGSNVALTSNPLLSDPGNGGTVGGYDGVGPSAYYLQASSPMIDAALDLNSQYGYVVGSTDYYGTSIPLNGSYDVGAYESTPVPTITLSGTLYESDGSTPITTGKTIALVVGTSTASKQTTTSDGSGAFSFNVAKSSGATSWLSSSAASAREWSSIAYGNGRFVAVAYAGTNNIMYSDDGINWTAVNDGVANGQDWESVTYGNGRFVAVASELSNDVMYSDDGITWTVSTSPENLNFWSHVTYGNGRFVAVSYDETVQVMYSDDGANWTAVSPAEVNTWLSVTYGEGKFVAVAIDGTNRVMYSTDRGETWSTASAAEANSWNSITYGNGRFVAVSDDGTNRAMYSDDGVTWTASAIDTNDWYGVTYGNSLFVAVADGTGGNDRIAVSVDGINWDTYTPPATFGTCYVGGCVTYGQGIFAAVSDTGTNRVMTSDAGLGPDTPFTFYVDGDAVDATTFMMGASSSNVSNIPLIQDTVTAYNANTNAASSTTKLSETVFYDSSNDSDILYTYATTTKTLTVDGSFRNEQGSTIAPYALAISGDFDNNATFEHSYGTTTLTGTNQTLTGTTTFYNLTHSTESTATTTFRAGETFATIGTLTLTGSTSATHYLRSTSEGTAFKLEPYATATADYLDVQDSHNISATTTSIECASTCVNSGNNVGWNLPAPPITISGTLYESDGSTPITTGKTIALVVGTSTVSKQTTTSDGSGDFSFSVATSSGAMDWNVATQPSTQSWRGITYGNGRFVAVSPYGSFMYSDDAVTWHSTSPSSAGEWSLVEYGNGRFVAVDRINGDTAYSYDGVTWTDGNNIGFAGSGLTAQMEFGNGVFVAVPGAAQDDQLAYSYDGINWTLSAVVNASTYYGLVYGNGRFIAVQYNAIYYSDDGINWSNSGVSFGTGCNEAYGAAYGNETFVVVCYNAGVTYNVKVSTDNGLTWTGHTLSEDNAWGNIGYGNGMFVMRADSGTNRLATSTDGINWNLAAVDSDTDVWPDGVTYGNGKFVFVDAAGSERIFYSDAGLGPDTPFTFYVDGDAVDATTYLSGATSTDISGVPLIQDTVTSWGATTIAASSSVDLEDALFYDATDDADILYTYATSTKTLTVDGAFRNERGTMLAPRILDVSGNFTNNATFEHNYGTTTLTGTSQTINGTTATTTFYNLEKSTASTDTLTFEAGNEFVTIGTLSLTGAASNLLSLRSSSNGSEYFFKPYATATADYLDVQDSHNISATTTSIECASTCVNSGNNVGWNLPAQAVTSGSEYMIRENTTDTAAITTTETIYGWDTETAVRGVSITYDSGTDLFTLSTGKYLVMYSQKWETSDTTDNQRVEIQGRIEKDGTTIVPGASQCFIRRLSGQTECITAGSAVVEVASSSSIVGINFYNTDTNTATDPTRENSGMNGVQVVKLSDDWDYARYKISSTLAADNTVAGTWSDVSWDSNLEEDAGFSRSGANITIANAGEYLVVYSLPIQTPGFRTEYVTRLTLDDVEVPGSRVTTYMRDEQGANDGVLRYAGIIEVAADDVLTIENERLEGGAATFQGGEIALIELPAEAETVIRSATTGDMNPASYTEFSWDTIEQIDTDTFTISSPTDSVTEVDVDGDYLFFWSQYGGSPTRAYPVGQISVDDTVLNYATAGEYGRNNTGSADQLGFSHGAFVPDMTAAENVSLENIEMGASGVATVSQASFSGIRLDSLLFAGTTFMQEGFRFRDGDGSESGAAWLAAQDTDISRATTTPFRLRTLINTSGSSTEEAFTLQFKEDSGSTWNSVATDPAANGGSSGFPTIMATSSGSSVGNVSSLAIDLPSGVQTGDLLLMFYAADIRTRLTITDNGWNKMGQHTSNNYEVAATVFWKIADGTDSATVIHADDSEASSYVVYRISGAGAPQAVATEYMQGVNADAPEINTDAERDYLFIVGHMSEGNADYATAAPSGYTDIITQLGDSSESTSIVTAHATATAQSEDPGAFTNPDAFNDWVVYTVAVPPALTAEVGNFGGAYVHDPSGSNDGSVGTLSWNNTSNISAMDTVNANVNLSGTAVTNYLYASTFGFSIPEDATIVGIESNITRIKSSGSGNASDSSVRLFKAGSAVGDNLALSEAWINGWLVKTYGSATTTWGTTWTPADINDTGFGVGISVAGEDGAVTGTINVDHVDIAVYYTQPGSPAVVLSQTASILKSGEDTTAQLAAPNGKTTSDFAAGRIQDDENPTDPILIYGDEYTELEWSLVLTDTALAGETYEFRVVTGVGDVLNAYSVTPAVTVATSAVTYATVSDHSSGQISNTFSFQNKVNEPLFAFQIDRQGENLDVEQVTVSLSGVNGIQDGEISSLALYTDTNNDGEYDGGDTVVDASGVLTITGQSGTIVFDADFTVTSDSDYLVIGDLISIDNGDGLTMYFTNDAVTMTAATSSNDVVVTIAVDSVQHSRNRGGGGSSASIGGSAPPGREEETGGEDDGGGEDAPIGEEPDGENIAADPNYFAPSAEGSPDGNWTNGGNGLASDGVYATAASTLTHSYRGFGFSIPGSNTITGIALKIDASGSTAAGTIDVALSWDNGSSYTSAKATPTLSGSDIVYAVGGQTDTWGRTWTPTQFSNSNFIVRVTAQPSSNTLNLDAIEVRVYHQATGGGGGGGGGL